MEKGKGTRKDKVYDLVKESFGRYEEEIQGKEDALKEEAEILKEELEDLKNTKNEQNEIDNEKARYSRFDPVSSELSVSIDNDSSSDLSSSVVESDSVVDMEIPLTDSQKNPIEYDENLGTYTFTSQIPWPSMAEYKNMFGPYLNVKSMLCILFPVLFLLTIVWLIFACLGVFALMVQYILGGMFGIIITLLIIFFAGCCCTLFSFSCAILYVVCRYVFRLFRFKNTYSFIGYLDKDKVDLRTDNQVRSEGKHPDAVYARFSYTRKIHVCHSHDYKDESILTKFLIVPVIYFGEKFAEYIPVWLRDRNELLVVSLEAFDQAKEFAVVDFTSTDQVAADKIKTFMKRLGTVWVNRHSKSDPLYNTVFLVWAYFKHNQQKTTQLPFHRDLISV